MTRIGELLALLHQGKVQFVVIGGVAMTLRGSSRTTIDVDICYARDVANLKALAAALAGLRPRLRGVAEAVPFLWDHLTLKSGLNFTLTTDLGDIDLLGEVAGIGWFAQVDALAGDVVVDGRSLRVLDLEGLERSKRAAGRAKDLMDLAELAAIRTRRSP